MCGCQHMESRKGYTEAKRLLKQHFDDEIRITSAYIEKALGWAAIRVEDEVAR